jgi:hypothetical protein
MMTQARRKDLFNNMKAPLKNQLDLDLYTDITDAKLDFILNSIIEVL